MIAWLLAAALGAQEPAAASELDRCLSQQALPRVARVVGPDGRVHFARVLEDVGGVPHRVAPLAADGTPLAEVLERAAAASPAGSADAGSGWPIPPAEAATRICAPFALAQSAIDAEQVVVVAAGLNYRAHAEEAGGGEVFLFPKPSAPTPPYAPLRRPAEVRLLDYEVELGFVLLADLALEPTPSREALLAQSAFFVSNEVTDREPIIRHAALDGPGTGFVEAKGQPGFLPAGPWLVRGRELFAALDACGADGLGLRLAVDAGAGFETRQDSTTALMLVDLTGLLERLADEVRRHGLRTAMPFERDGETRFHPIAVDETAPRLPAGSVVLTGTPAGVALGTPDPLGLVLRGAVRLRGPFEQFRREQLARAEAREPGGYLAPGDRVRASIDGLGTQQLTVTGPEAAPDDPCAPH